MNKIYVAGPYTKGDVAMNVRAAITAGNNLRALGWTPFIPHLTHFWHMLIPHDISYWYSFDMEWLEMCDALFLLPGESVGAAKEVIKARQLGMPVYTTFAELPDLVIENG
jgi:uncharacterized protein DUF4406